MGSQCQRTVVWPRSKPSWTEWTRSSRSVMKANAMFGVGGGWTRRTTLKVHVKGAPKQIGVCRMRGSFYPRMQQICKYDVWSSKFLSFVSFVKVFAYGIHERLGGENEMLEVESRIEATCVQPSTRMSWDLLLDSRASSLVCFMVSLAHTVPTGPQGRHPRSCTGRTI